MFFLFFFFRIRWTLQQERTHVDWPTQWKDANANHSLFLPLQTCIMVKVIGIGVELLLMDPWGPIHPEATTSVTLNRSDWPELSSYTCRISVRHVLTAPSLFIFSVFSQKPSLQDVEDIFGGPLCPCRIITSSITQCFYLDLVAWP